MSRAGAAKPATFKFPCRACGSDVTAPVNGIGKKGRCPRCRHEVVVPDPADPALTDTTADFNSLDLSGEQAALPDWIAGEPETTPPLATPPVTFAAWPPQQPAPQSASGLPMMPPRPSARPQRRKPEATIAAIFDFDVMFSVVILRCLWFLGAAAITLGPIGALVVLSAATFRQSGWAEWSVQLVIGAAASVVTVVLGNVVWRLIFESAIVFFKMHETLEELLAEARAR